MKQGRPKHATPKQAAGMNRVTRIGAKQTTGPSRTNYSFGGMRQPASSIPMSKASPQQVQDAKQHPITDKPSPTDAHWGTNLGVPMMNPNNPYSDLDEVS